MLMDGQAMMLLCSGSVIPAGLASVLSLARALRLLPPAAVVALGKALRSRRFVATLNPFLIPDASLFLCVNYSILTLLAPSAPRVISLVSTVSSPGRRWISHQHCLPV